MGDYIRELRALVGHRPLVMAAAGVVVLDQEGRVLLLRRSDDGAWGLPGGAMEPGESAEETASRETMEETGLTVGRLDLFGVFSGPEMAHTYPNGDQVHIVSVVFSAREWQGRPFPADGENLETRFFGPSELPADISGPNRPILRRLIEAAGNLPGRDLALSGVSAASSDDRRHPLSPHGYIRDLRGLVGHRPLTMTGACVLVVDALDRVLLLRRSDEASWGPPGGMTEPGESIEATAHRETSEETGLTLGRLELFGVFSGPEVAHTYPNGDHVHNVTVAFRARDWQGTPFPADGENLEARFFGPTELPGNIASPVRPILRRYVEMVGRGQSETRPVVDHGILRNPQNGGQR